MSKSDQREFDIVMWGATGFTGGLVAEYLAALRGVRWAIAGRSRQKLEEVHARLLEISESAEDVGVIVADSHDRASLDEMCARTRVVASTVGPFARHGAELVAACVAHGTHYCDITGEPQFVRRMIDEHHDAAKDAGVRIVHCCGFDSIPSDLGTHCVQTHVIELTGSPAVEVHTQVRRMKGQASGGTIESIANIIDEARRDPEVRKIAGNPYSLNPPDKRDGPRVDMQSGVRKRGDRWTAPFLMASINMKIVRRSHALLHPDAGHLDYSEVSAFGGDFKGLRRAAGAVGLFGAVGVGLGIPPVRKLLVSRVLPEPGEGPSREEIAAGGFEFAVMADAGGRHFECTVVGTSDPGYGETSKMLAESARCLAFDDPPADLDGGVLTPASGMGMALVERLRDAGMRFDVSVT